MAFTTTTLSSAVLATDRTIAVTSATSFVAGQLLRIDGEFMQIAQNYVSGTSIPVLRGRDGTVTAAHVNAANVTTGLGSDWSNPPSAVPDSVTDPILPLIGAGNIYSYGASGAIAPIPGIHVLIGTGTLAMTLANPTKDQDGQILIIIGNGKSASTIDYPDATGLSNAGSSYDTISFQNAGFCAIMHMAMNGAWVLLGAPITGTSTALSIAIA